MKNKLDVSRLLRSVWNFSVFFFAIGFITTCCMLLFLNVMSKSLGIVWTGENLGVAARLTFINVVFLSLVVTAADAVRRKFTVERPAKRITDAAERIMKGDFDVRIPVSNKPELFPDDAFNRIAECFNNMAKELSGIETLQTDFISNVSHELKTPLAVIRNYGTLLGKPGLSDRERMEYADIIAASAGKLSDLVSNILKLNKLENQQIYPNVRRYNLGEQLCECLLAFENVWEQKQLEIVTNIRDDIFVESDSELLSIVWNNLFSNAMKFTENGGTVSVSLAASGKDAVVCVSDTGCGISGETGPRIFDKFYQGDTSHSVSGNGLGLALVKRVVDITGSSVSVESETGKGSTFTVTLPLSGGGAP